VVALTVRSYNRRSSARSSQKGRFTQEEDRTAYSRSTAAAVAGLAALLLAPGVSLGQGPTVRGAGADQVTWKLERLSQEPFKLLRATPDPKGTEVRFLIEFTRPITLAEQIDWLRPDGGPVVFRFLDADGVVMQSVTPRLEGQLVYRRGTRIRLVLPMPDPRILALAESIRAD
jgi:hypothetical protein